MASITRKYTEPLIVLKRLHILADTVKSSIAEEHPEAILDDFSGKFYSPSEQLGFDDRKEYEAILRQINLGDYHNALCSFSFGKDFNKFLICSVMLSANTVEVEFRRTDYVTLEKLFDKFQEIFSECELVKPDPLEAERRKTALAAESCVDILYKVPDFQSRIEKSFDNEKQVQNFLYPILKSHFSDLVDEEFLPKVAGSGNKPDFCIPSSGLLVECKYLREKQDFKKIRDEIAADLVGYFSQKSGYEQIIVFIYNGGNKPTPANYISNLKSASNKIIDVIISPGMTPQ